MSAFRVVIEGGNVMLRMEGSIRRMGFYTTRFVRASDSEEAGAVAVRQARHDLGALALNEPEDPPAVSVQAIESIPFEEVPTVPSQGFVWFSDD
jgi:hypothetical protein